MCELADRLDFAGKWASLATVMFVALTVTNPSRVMLALTFLFIAPAYLMPAIADWLRTKSVLEAIRSHGRTIALSTPAQPGVCKLPASAEHIHDWQNLPIEWDSPSPSIH